MKQSTFNMIPFNNTTHWIVIFLNILTLLRKRSTNQEENIIVYLIRIILLTGLYCTALFYTQERNYITKGAIASAVEFARLYTRSPATLVTLISLNMQSKTILNITSSYKYKSKTFIPNMFIKILIVQLSFGSWSQLITRNISMAIFHIPLMLWKTTLLSLTSSFKTLNYSVKLLQEESCYVVSFKRLNSLKNVAKTHGRLCKGVVAINGVFGWFLLFHIPALFVEIIFDAFAVCRMLKGGLDFKLEVIGEVLLNVLALVEIVLPYESVRAESEAFANELSKIQGDGNELSGLLLQAHHAKLNLSVFGILPVDGTLIYAIFGAVTTYLIILLQFDT